MISIGNVRNGFIGQHQIYVGRQIGKFQGSALGNPYKIGVDGDRNEVIEKYRRWLWQEVKNGHKSIVYQELLKIGRRYQNGEKVKLMCWCYPKKCHAEVIRNCINWMFREGLI